MSSDWSIITLLIGQGLFECAYSPRKTQKLVICVNYGGVAVPDSPFRVTVDDVTPNIGCSIKTPDGGDLKDLKVDQPRPDTAGKAKVSPTHPTTKLQNQFCRIFPLENL